MLMRRRSLARYIAPAADPLRHFRIVWGATHRGFETLPCLLARGWADGKFELLNPGWEMLGFARDDLAGRYVCELVALTPKAARGAMKSLLAEDGPLEFGLRCKDRREVPYRWYRQFDDFTTSMFIVGDQLPAARIAVAPPRAASAAPESLHAS